MNYPSWIPLNSEKTTSFICEWGSCAFTPTEYIIFGCLDQHLGELVLCRQHTAVWVRTLPSMRCGCGEPIDEYWNLLIRNVHPTWLSGLLRDQNARRAGQYLTNLIPQTVRPSKQILVTQPRGNGKWKSK